MVKTRCNSFASITALLIAIFAVPPRGHSQTLEWTRQLESGVANDVSADGLGNAYVSGWITPSGGAPDAFVGKFDAAGNLQWSRTLSTNTEDWSWGVSADRIGNVYLAGHTGGGLDGNNYYGGWDAFVAKYDAAGNRQWTRQLGTNTSDFAYGVSADRLGNIYLSGMTRGSLGGTNAGDSDAFISKYDAAGDLKWTRQLGTLAADFGLRVSADGLGNAYLSGATFGSLDGPNAGNEDAFVAKYDSAGDLLWTRQLGTNVKDQSNGVAADGLGNVYLSGATLGSLGGTNAGGDDAFLAKYDAVGNLLWTRQLGTNLNDGSADVSADGLGNVYLSGESNGSLDGTDGEGGRFIAKYDETGNLLWTTPQLGRFFGLTRYGASADGLGNIYYTSGDPSLVKFSDVVPEPHSGLLLIMGMLATHSAFQRNRTRLSTGRAVDRVGGSNTH